VELTELQQLPIFRQANDLVVSATSIATRGGEVVGNVVQTMGAINDMDQTTQQNAALVEEASAAAESLSEQTIQLSGALAVPAVGNDRLALPQR